MLRRIAAFLAMVCLVLAVAAPAEADLNSKVKKLNKKVNNVRGRLMPSTRPGPVYARSP